MTATLAERLSALPYSIALSLHVPVRRPFTLKNWTPSAVRSADDLPPYLMLGPLDAVSFTQSEEGWSARWQGTEPDTHVDVTYEAEVDQWEIRQTWCGIDGGIGYYSAQIPLERAVATLYAKFPPAWHEGMKTRLESTYQLTVVPKPKGGYTLCGIPDGALHTIVFPVAVKDLRATGERIARLAESAGLCYPLGVEARKIFQAINYVEGKAPDWTSQGWLVFIQSAAETGLPPQGQPVREAAADGSAAWTLRRETYYLFITLPFAALTDFLARLASEDGPIRLASHPPQRFEWRPAVLPCGYELQVPSLALWDAGKTTRLFLQFGPVADVKKANLAAMEGKGTAEADLANVEAISAQTLAFIDQAYEQAG